ncbi:Amino acid transporter transmembrane [Penicillium alfredii]|uniref:Amino acid transporter transmembrane n=1 Tax=Penicillium alfredii TaxID=1506179 RepID=A0A9W9EQS9_9EURO|nr:Amino acid transporter transmembrane [Penicillium alfredii]KAJ5086303.1 Amino acid transporter transmembrane [Penicillium alfredii]
MERRKIKSDSGLSSTASVLAGEMKASPDAKSTVSRMVESLEKQDPFGDETQAGVKYKTMAWWQAGMSILTILGIGIISTYTGYTIGQLKCRYMQIHSMADAGDLLLGRLGRRTLGAAQLLFFVFVMGSHVLTFSIMMNVLTEHSTCTIVFSVTGMLVSFLLTLPRRLEKLSHLSSVSFISIIGAVLASMIGVSLDKAPIHLPTFSPTPTVHDAFLAIANVVFAYAGHVAFFTLFSELREIKDFPKALALLQMSEMILYTVTAIVIYAFVGPAITSPALNSAGRLFRRISYGIAIPTVCLVALAVIAFR